MAQQNHSSACGVVMSGLVLVAFFFPATFAKAAQGAGPATELIHHPDAIKLPAEESLLRAVENRDIDGMKQAISRGANLNAAGENDQTPLMIASQLGSVAMVKALVDAGAKLNIEARKTGVTALKLAAREGRRDVVDVLLNAGAAIDHRGLNNQRNAFAGAAALSHAAANGQPAMVSHLMSRGANPNLENYMSLTPIMYAAGEGKIESLKALLDAGVLAGHASSLGLTPLMAAAQSGQWKPAIYLLGAGADPDQQISATAKSLTPDAPGMTALMISVLAGNQQTFFAILLSGADLSLKRADGKTALDLAMDRLKQARTDEHEYKKIEPVQRALFLPDWGKKRAMLVLAEELEDEVEKNDVDIVTAGLRIGVDPNVLIDEDEPLFFRAIKDGNLALVNLMLEHGARPNVQDRNGNTAFYVSMYREEFEIAKVLIARGADANILPRDIDETLLHELAGAGRAEAVKLLLRAGMRVDSRDNRQNTPLHKAARSGEVETFKLLLDAGANPKLRNIHGERPTDQVYDSRLTPQFLKLVPGMTMPRSTAPAKSENRTQENSRPATGQRRAAQDSMSKSDEFDFGDLDF